MRGLLDASSSVSAPSRAPACSAIPSDGYHGKTISFSVRNFWAEVVLYEWDTVEIVLAEDDRARFRACRTWRATCGCTATTAASG